MAGVRKVLSFVYYSTLQVCICSGVLPSPNHNAVISTNKAVL